MVVQIPLNSDRYRAYQNTGTMCAFCVRFDAEPGSCGIYDRTFELVREGSTSRTKGVECTGYEQIREAVGNG